MLLANMNWMGMLCEKLAGVKDCVIVEKNNFGGYPHGGEVWEGCVKCFQHISTVALLLEYMNWLGMLCETLAGVKGCVIVKKSFFGEGVPTERGGLGGLCDIFLTDPQF